MPLIVKSQIFTTDKNIMVFKKVRKEGDLIVSPYHVFYWELGKIYHIPQLTMVNNIAGMLFVYEGFHAYLEALCADSDCILAKMIIPKGSKYALGIGPHIVSDTMMFYTLL
jgi:hypothetical protein